MRRVLAISGGVDSVVMLDFLAHKYPAEELVVAHFNHDLRDNSDADEVFVKNLAKQYGLEFVSQKVTLEKASEEVARNSRYEFLREVARKKAAAIYTAHHLDDLVETVAINCLRGTGWRGLAVLDAPGVRRPFLESEEFYEPLDKNAILEYAAKRKLHFREDQTNASDVYLRNRVREKLFAENWNYEKKLEIYQLWKDQKQLRAEIDQNVVSLLPETTWQRSWFRELDKNTALELLRAGTLRAGISTTRPQLEDFRQAIMDYLPGKSFNLPNDRLIRFTKTEFEL